MKPIQLLNRFLFVNFLGFFLFAGCGVGGGGGDDTVTTVQPSSTILTTTTTTTTLPNRINISGNVTDGNPLNGLSIFTVDTNGNQSSALGVTSGDGDGQGSYTISVFENAFPLIVYAERSGETPLSAIVPSASNVINLNPVTTVTTQSELGTDIPAVLSKVGRYGTDGHIHRIVARQLSEVTENDLKATGETVSNLAFGDAVSYEKFSTANFTTSNFQNTLFRVVQNLSAVRTVDDLLSIAIDPNNPDVSSNLLDTETFQSQLAGQLVADGKTAQEGYDFIRNAVVSDPNSKNGGKLLSNSESLLTLLTGIKQSADTSITESTKNIASVALGDAVATAIEGSTITNQGDLTTVFEKMVAIAGPVLLALGKDNQNSFSSETDLQIMMKAVGDEISQAILDNTFDLKNATTSESDTLSNIAGTMASALSGPLVTSLKTDTATMTSERKEVFSESIAAEVAEVLVPFVPEMKTATLSVEAAKTASNMTVALGGALGYALKNNDSTSFSGQVVETLSDQVASRTRRTIQQNNINLTGNLPTEAVNIAVNLATVGLESQKSTEQVISTTDPEKQAVIAAGTLEQALKAASDLNLTGALPTTEASNIVANSANLVAKSLESIVINGSVRAGANLEVLARAVADGVASRATTTGLTEVLSSTQLASGNQIAAEVGISVETTFTNLEQKTSLENVTLSFVESNLDGSAIASVGESLSQSLAGTNTAAIAVAKDVSKAATKVAQGLLDSGSEITQVKQSVLAITDAIKSASATDQSAIKKAAQVVEVGVDAVVKGQAKDLANNGQAATLDPVVITDRLATAITTQTVSGDAKNLDASEQILSTLQTNSGAGTTIILEDIWSGATLAAAETVQTALVSTAETNATSVTATLADNSETAKAVVLTALEEGSSTLGLEAQGNIVTTTQVVTTAAPTTTLPPVVVETTTTLQETTTLPATTIPDTTTSPISTVILTTTTTSTTTTLETTTTTLRDPNLIARIELLNSFVHARSPYANQLDEVSLGQVGNYCEESITHYYITGFVIEYNDNGVLGTADEQLDDIQLRGKVKEVGGTAEYGATFLLKYQESSPGIYFFVGGNDEIGMTFIPRYQVTLPNSSTPTGVPLAPIEDFSISTLGNEGYLLSMTIKANAKFKLTETNLNTLGTGTDAVPSAIVDTLTTSMKDIEYNTEIEFITALTDAIGAEQVALYKTRIVQEAVIAKSAYSWIPITENQKNVTSCPNNAPGR